MNDRPERGEDSTSSAGVDEYKAILQRVLEARPSGTRGRLLFAMDATASREPTWDHACSIQGEMFVAADTLGGLDVRLGFYRGFDEFKVSRWTSDGRELARTHGLPPEDKAA